MSGMLVVLRGLQQRFRWDAADIRASATRRRAPIAASPIVDAGGSEAELRAADGGDVTAGAGADDEDVELFSHYFFPTSPANFVATIDEWQCSSRRMKTRRSLRSYDKSEVE